MKPALKYMFIYDFYSREHTRLPGSLRHKRLFKKRRSVILSWWNRLPRVKRDALITEAERIVASYNTILVEHRQQIRQWIDEIQERIRQHRASQRYAKRRSV